MASNAWELWARSDGESHFVNAFRDKGEAKRWAARLKRSHPYVSYFVKHRRSGGHMHFGTRSWKRRRGHR